MDCQREMNLIDSQCSPLFISYIYVCVNLYAVILQVCSNIHIRKCKCVCARLSVELNNQRICRYFSLFLSTLIFFLSWFSLLYLSLPLFLSFFFFQVAFTTILKRISRSENYYHDASFIEVVQSLSCHTTGWEYCLH